MPATDIYPSPTGDHLQRIRRISRAMVLSCNVLMLLLPLALIWYWATASASELAALGHLPPDAIQGPVQAWQRAAAGAATAVPLTLLLVGIWHARRCFTQFARGEVFNVQATVCLRRFAGWVAAAAIAAIVAATFTSVVLTLNNLPGMRQVAVGLHTSHCFTAFFAALVWLMADVIGQGQQLADENRQFV